MALQENAKERSTAIWFISLCVLSVVLTFGLRYVYNHSYSEINDTYDYYYYEDY